jgi:hypothetical protein
MKWKMNDLEKYEDAKEYIDTLLIPLVPFQLGDDEASKKAAFQEEVMQIFAREIEQELSGRVMLLPSYIYLKSSDLEMEVSRLNEWRKDASEQPFHHIIFLTFDSAWKKHESKLEGELLWLPGMHTGDIHSKEMQTIMRDQIGQVSEIIRSYW